MPLLSYGLQYTMPFRSGPVGEGDDPRGQLWRVQFYRKAFSGTVTELKVGEIPWREDTPELLYSVIPKRITIEVISSVFLLVDLASFYTASDREMLVELQQETTGGYLTHSTGWLNPYDTTELYQFRGPVSDPAQGGPTR